MTTVIIVAPHVIKFRALNGPDFGFILLDVFFKVSSYWASGNDELNTKARKELKTQPSWQQP